MRLLLVRHGQTPANAAGVLDADVPGPGLTELGQRQARALPAALREERIGSLFVSTMIRTSLTAAPLASALGLTGTELPGLREIGAGDLQGRSDDAAIGAYLAVVRGWAAGDPSPRIPGGEDGHEFFARYDDAVARIAEAATGGAHDSGDPAVAAVAVSHGAAIRTWCAARLPGGLHARENLYPLENTGVVVLEGDPEGGWRLVSWTSQPAGGAALDDPGADDPTGTHV